MQRIGWTSGGIFAAALAVSLAASPAPSGTIQLASNPTVTQDVTEEPARQPVPPEHALYGPPMPPADASPSVPAETTTRSRELSKEPDPVTPALSAEQVAAIEPQATGRELTAESDSARRNAEESQALGVPTSAPLNLNSDKTTDAESPASFFAGIGRTLLALGGVIFLILLVAGAMRWGARHSGALTAALGAGGRAPSGVIEVLARYPVGRGVRLVLLRVDQRVLLLSQNGGGRLGGSGFQTLSEISDPDDVASILMQTRNADSESLAARFRGILGQFERDTLDDGQPDSHGDSGRRVEATDDGDVVELWESRQSLPFPPSEHAEHRTTPSIPSQSDEDSLSALRNRLAAMQGSTSHLRLEHG